MHKNQLQEFAQRSNFNLPAYSCVREGPDHAPRFKATVNFNGELFESPEFFSTLRQAEHAAAEVALNVLSRRGPSQSLAAKILDETGICKNLLQETAQRAGVSLPVYTTIKGAVNQVPVFSCTVEVGGKVFAGEPAKSKKQAEKNAAMTAWASIKQLTQPPWSTDCKDSSTSGKLDSGSSVASAPVFQKRDGRGQVVSRFRGGHSRVRMVNVRERNRFNWELSPVEQFLERGVSPPTKEVTYESQRFLFNQQPRSSRSSHRSSHLEGSLSSTPSIERSYESQRFLFNQQPHVTGSDLGRSGSSTHQRSHSLTGLALDSLAFSPLETLGLSGGFTSGGGHLGKAPLPRQRQPRASRLSFQSSSDRIELRRPLVEEFQLQQSDGDPDWFNALGGTTSTHIHSQQCDQQQESSNMLLQSRRAQSERFELKPSLFDELYRRDEEELWSRGEMLQSERERVAAYEGCADMGKYMYNDVNKGSSGTISHISGYGNEPGGFGSNSPYVGSGSSAGDRGSSPPYNEHSNVSASLYAAFSTDSLSLDRGDSYGRFNVDSTETSFFKNETLEDTFSGNCNPASSSAGNVHGMEEFSSPSPSRWQHSAQWMNSLPSVPSTVLHSWGFRTSAIAPPIHVRQVVAVCSAPPPQSIAVDSSVATNTLHYGTPSNDNTFEEAESVSFAKDMLQQLRLE